MATGGPVENGANVSAGNEHNGYTALHLASGRMSIIIIPISISIIITTTTTTTTITIPDRPLPCP
jgi:hypothetical protein